MNKTLITSTVAAATLFATMSVSFAQSAISGAQHPFPTYNAQDGAYGAAYGQTYGQVREPTYGSYGAAYGSANGPTADRTYWNYRYSAPVLSPSEAGEPAPDQIR